MDVSASFGRFLESSESGLRRALVALFGVEDGRDAASHALMYGWENWARLSDMKNPAGYLYRVGQTWGRRNRRSGADVVPFPQVSSDRDPLVEPSLPAALNGLPDRQRVAVVLRHGSDWDYDAIASFMGISSSAARKNVERALTALRVSLGVQIES